MELLTGYITIGSMVALYGMAAMVVCVELVAIGKDLATLRKK